MTAEERQYLKRAVDARRRIVLTQAGDRKFRHLAQTEATSGDGDGQVRPIVAIALLSCMTLLMTLALLVEHHFA